MQSKELKFGDEEENAKFTQSRPESKSFETTESFESSDTEST